METKFNGSIKEFAELIAPVVRHKFVSELKGKWILGQVLYVKIIKPRKVVITNASY